MVTYYNKKDVLSFGNFLLSTDRKQKIMSTPDVPEEILEERLTSVSHADFENWKATL